MQKKKHIIILLIIFFVLQVSFINVSNATNNIGEKGFNDIYVYEALSSSNKTQSGVIPRKYNVSLDSIYEDTITVKENPNLFNLFGLLSKEKIIVSNATEIPTEFDLSEKINIEAEDQGFEGLCWAFASLTSLETNLALNGYGEYDFSEAHVDYLTSIEFGGERFLRSSGNFEVFMDYIYKNNGPVLEETVPYDTLYTEEQYEYLDGLESKAYVLEKVDFPTINKAIKNYSDEELLLFRDKVKKHIMENGSIYTNILGEDIKMISEAEDVEEYTLYNSSEDIDHAVSIIGWDDNYPKEKFQDINGNMPQNNGAYIALNSWGDIAKIVYISYEDYTVEREMSGIVSATTNVNEVGSMEVIFKDINLYNAIKTIFSKAIISSNDETKSINFLGFIDDLETSINISEKNIQDLTGLEKFKLQALTAYTNNISDIDVLKDLKDMRFLDLRNNKISNVNSLENLTNLKAIYLDYNELSNLNFLKDIKSLEILSVIDTKISDISGLENLTNLKEIYIDFNELSNLSFLKDIKSLEVLEANNNKISDISGLENLINLKEVNISENNNISDISKLINLVNLKELNISFNNISDISPLKDLMTLEVLDITGNKISNIDSLSNLKSLNAIWASDNEISNIDSLVNLECLKTLVMSSNNIENVSVLNSLKNLEYLRFENNNIDKQISLSDDSIITIALPNIFIEAQKEGSLIYSEEGIEFINCNLSNDNMSVQIDVSKTLNASVKIKSGEARKTIFNIDVKKNVTEVEIKEFPKKIYQKGEELDLTGGIITVTYENGNTEEILMKDIKVTVDGYDKEKIGVQEIIVKFGEKSDVFYIEVFGDGKIESDKYKITDDDKEAIIKGIMPNITVSKLLEDIKCNESFDILDLKNNNISISDKIGTGFIISLLNGKKYTLVVYGDITGDGVISISELAAASRAATGANLSLERVKFMAIDINNDGIIKVSDLSVISRLRNQQ